MDTAGYPLLLAAPCESRRILAGLKPGATRSSLLCRIFVAMPRHAPSEISGIHAARTLMLAGRPRDALRRIAAFKTPFATLHIVRGECCYVLGEWADAVWQFEEALRLSPNSPRAEILLMLAQEMLELSRTMRPTDSIASFTQNTSANASVAEEFKAGKEIPKPTEPPDEIGLVSETLAELMVRQGKLDDARKVYIQLSRLNPDRYEYFRERIQKLDNSE
jgi:tetratricopeptide (TPR) repeat protein